MTWYGVDPYSYCYYYHNYYNSFLASEGSKGGSSNPFSSNGSLALPTPEIQGHTLTNPGHVVEYSLPSSSYSVLPLIPGQILTPTVSDQCVPPPVYEPSAPPVSFSEPTVQSVSSSILPSSSFVASGLPATFTDQAFPSSCLSQTPSYSSHNLTSPVFSSQAVTSPYPTQVAPTHSYPAQGLPPYPTQTITQPYPTQALLPHYSTQTLPTPYSSQSVVPLQSDCYPGCSECPLEPNWNGSPIYPCCCCNCLSCAQLCSPTIEQEMVASHQTSQQMFTQQIPELRLASLPVASQPATPVPHHMTTHQASSENCPHYSTNHQMNSHHAVAQHLVAQQFASEHLSAHHITTENLASQQFATEQITVQQLPVQHVPVALQVTDLQVPLQQVSSQQVFAQQIISDHAVSHCIPQSVHSHSTVAQHQLASLQAPSSAKTFHNHSTCLQAHQSISQLPPVEPKPCEEISSLQPASHVDQQNVDSNKSIDGITKEITSQKLLSDETTHHSSTNQAELQHVATHDISSQQSPIQQITIQLSPKKPMITTSLSENEVSSTSECDFLNDFSEKGLSHLTTGMLVNRDTNSPISTALTGKRDTLISQGSFEYNVSHLPQALRNMFGPLKCDLCNVTCNSFLTAMTHYEGKIHSRKVEKYLKDNNINLNKSNVKKSKTEFVSTSCQVCSVLLTSELQAMQHFTGKAHKKKVWNNEIMELKAKKRGVMDFNEKEDDAITEHWKACFKEYTEYSQKRLHEHFCSVCNIFTLSGTDLSAHQQTPKHIKNLMDSQNESNSAYDTAESREASLINFKTPSGEYYCIECDVSADTSDLFLLHIKSVLHKCQMKRKEQIYKNKRLGKHSFLPNGRIKSF